VPSELSELSGPELPEPEVVVVTEPEPPSELLSVDVAVVVVVVVVSPEPPPLPSLPDVVVLALPSSLLSAVPPSAETTVSSFPPCDPDPPCPSWPRRECS
jgi:hypothetical protein